MLKKLLKYDMRAVSRLWWIGAVISVAAALVGGLLIRLFITSVNDESTHVLIRLISIFGMIIAMLCIFALALSFVFTVVLVLIRFYKHFFTDEGYLTFTLPVKRSALFLSKIVNAVIWFSAHFAVITVSVLLFILLAIPPEEGGFFLNFILFQELGQLFSLLWEGMGPWLIVYLLEALLLILASLVFSILLIYFCITFGSMVVKRAKLILALGIYYTVNSVLVVICQFGILIFGSAMGWSMDVLMDGATHHQICAACAFLFLGALAAMATISAILYSVTQRMIDRRLNLS